MLPLQAIADAGAKLVPCFHFCMAHTCHQETCRSYSCKAEEGSNPHPDPNPV